MSNTVLWEIIGYIGSALVLVSLLMSSVVKLRIINLIGSLVFAVYAFKIHSIPTALMNLALVGINVFYLTKYLNQKNTKVFTTMPVTPEDSAVRVMLGKYQSDMEKFFGRVNLSAADTLYVVYDGDTLAGLTAGVKREDEIELILDYATPGYRDCSVGHCILNTLEREFRQVSFVNPDEKHIAYLLKMGFRQEGQRYCKHFE